MDFSRKLGKREPSLFKVEQARMRRERSCQEPIRMSQTPNKGTLAGKWTYRSFLSNSDLSVPFNNLEFGRGTITVAEAPRADGDDWRSSLVAGSQWFHQLRGSLFSSLSRQRHRGKEEWVYDYIGCVIKPWPNGVNQVPAMTGSVVRTIPHSDGSGRIAPRRGRLFVDRRLAGSILTCALKVGKLEFHCMKDLILWMS